MSSDAFSSFSKGTIDSKINNSEVFKACKILKMERIPKFSKMITYPTKNNFNLKWLSIAMQQRGINVRYMGLVRNYSEDKKIKDHCLYEMAYRVIKLSLKRFFLI